jgi:hypothetical protein
MNKKYYWIVGIIVIITIILISVLYDRFGGHLGNTLSKSTEESSCEDSGGKIITQSCCKPVADFPNTCLIGACGCSPDNSKEVKVCDCGEGKCWDNAKQTCVTR